jgi:hypothetical protein
MNRSGNRTTIRQPPPLSIRSWSCPSAATPADGIVIRKQTRRSLFGRDKRFTNEFRGMTTGKGLSSADLLKMTDAIIHCG